MAKILIINSSLKHAQDFVDPFVQRLLVHLSKEAECVDVRTTNSFDERTFFEYDQVIFAFMTALDSIPSSTLEVFQKLEGQPKNNADVYALIACDEYETEKCDLSQKIIEKWCEKENLHFRGSLKIGSVLFINKSASKFVVANYIKGFAIAILKQAKVYSRVTMLTENIFMKTANKYWNKEIKKKSKEKRQKK